MHPDRKQLEWVICHDHRHIDTKIIIKISVISNYAVAE